MRGWCPVVGEANIACIAMGIRADVGDFWREKTRARSRGGRGDGCFFFFFFALTSAAENILLALATFCFCISPCRLRLRRGPRQDNKRGIENSRAYLGLSVLTHHDETGRMCNDCAGLAPMARQYLPVFCLKTAGNRANGTKFEFGKLKLFRLSSALLLKSIASHGFLCRDIYSSARSHR